MFRHHFHTPKQRVGVNLKNRLASFQANLFGCIHATENCYSHDDLSTDDIETRLRETANNLAIPMIASVPESERAEMIAKINVDYKVKLTDDSRAKILTRQLYDKFDLPELTLFEI